VFSFFFIGVIFVIPGALNGAEEDLILRLIMILIMGLLFCVLPYRISKKIKSKLGQVGLPLLWGQWETKIRSVFSFTQAEVSKLQNNIEERIDDAKRIRERQEQLLEEEKWLSGSDPIPCFVQGGAGVNFSTGEAILLSCRPDSICLLNLKTERSLLIPFAKLTNLEIDGPGRTISNLGLSGGGFGAEGATHGILIASVINALTSVSTTNTFLRIGFSDSEALLHLKTIEPSKLRIILSPAFAVINQRIANVSTSRDSTSIPSLSMELEKLGHLRRDGILSEEEFVAAKQQLLAGH
jgi:hypothetical protein